MPLFLRQTVQFGNAGMQEKVKAALDAADKKIKTVIANGKTENVCRCGFGRCSGKEPRCAPHAVRGAYDRNMWVGGNFCEPNTS